MASRGAQRQHGEANSERWLKGLDVVESSLIRDYHVEQAAAAKAVYLASRSAPDDSADWAKALRLAREKIADTLRASDSLSKVAYALQQSGAHSLVLRHLMAPPISQDQFALLCPEWSKQREKTGGRTPSAKAQAVASAFELWRSRSLTSWVDQGRPPLKRELKRLLWAIAPLIANQQIQTIQRTRAAAAQEGAVIAMLERKGWTRLPARSLDTRGDLPPLHYSYKTRFATEGGSQEVDLALGLHGVVVLAMECKVSNDKTNSIKRINDVVKKAVAWKDHWARFVRTAALLQGVINPSDVHRLLDKGVDVFWSHDLARFETWLDAEIAAGEAIMAQERHVPYLTTRPKRV